MKILVSDKLSDEGLSILQGEANIQVDVRPGMSADELREQIGNYEGILIRSGTKLTADALSKPGDLRVIVRAGVGVDNVDLAAATRNGILVMNTPDANTLSTAEVALTLMMALSRNIVPAANSLTEGKWDRKSFVGAQLAGKTLGVIGLGRIGMAVAQRALGLAMNVVSYDPFVGGSKTLEEKITQVDSLEDLLRQADYLTVHTPLTDGTRGLIGKKELALLPEGARVINAARGGIIDEDALADALESGHLAGAALDVFTAEPPTNRRLIENPKALCIPHLGASTVEAQQNVAIEAARTLVAYLKNGEVTSAVNAPAVDFAKAGEMRAYLELGHRLGSILSSITMGRIKAVRLNYAGEITQKPVEQITVSVVIGLLERHVQQRLNLINALIVAREHNIDVQQTTALAVGPYTTQLSATVVSDKEEHTISGTVFSDRYARVVTIDDFPVELRPEGDLVVTYTMDRPGVIGGIGTLFGEKGINISSMTFGRKKASGESCVVLSLDSPPPDEVMEALKEKDFVARVYRVSLPPLGEHSA
ncbi:MAG: phosphoglycerate dehydrogenase [Phycisphaerae bacterium]|nr:phosphoglycerate dehydrogenase [Phycisphaerae bacterium]